MVYRPYSWPFVSHINHLRYSYLFVSFVNHLRLTSACVCVRVFMSTGRSGRNRSGTGGSNAPSCCSHRRHARLEGLRTLVLADNLLSRLCLYLEDGDLLQQQQQQEPLETEVRQSTWLTLTQLESVWIITVHSFKDKLKTLSHQHLWDCFY